ncbi:hypothetical protein X777_05850 [Ooceraea biroi]|uniref:Uncharacterized protein n=1 Tax=Ooceraea biroi TaxID=2015173 RepID=A0A026WEA7_OOCBI|nr:hypothetical protein X777_05850 [Ooceraea biroi]
MDRDDMVESMTKESASATSTMTIDFQHFRHINYLLARFSHLSATFLFNAIDLFPIFVRHNLDPFEAQYFAQFVRARFPFI